MDNNSRAVWVIAEQREGEILPVSLQLIGKARTLADDLGTKLEAVLLGENVTGQHEPLIAAGADRVYLGDARPLGDYQADHYTDIIVELARKSGPDIMLIGSTATGRELAPLVAAHLKTGLTAHCIELEINAERILEQRVPAYGGLLTIVCPERRPQMATAARGVFPSPIMDERRTGEVIRIETQDLPESKVRTLEIHRQEAQGMSLESAPVIVAGGAGAGDAEGWQLIVRFAEALNAAVGSTRPAVDEGWTSIETMIGQSGKMVSPDLYIGVGLSGELQHMVGISGAKVMVAINNDPKSPVFEQVDYGIVDDLREFLPVLLEKIKEHQEKVKPI
jgi:electron transfer flavoprotein alpha subunit